MVQIVEFAISCAQPLPWTISHPINKFSPLYGLTKREMMEQECEIIIIFDVIDELSSKNFQVCLGKSNVLNC